MLDYLPNSGSNDGYKNPMCSDNQPCLQIFVAFVPITPVNDSANTIHRTIVKSPTTGVTSFITQNRSRVNETNMALSEKLISESNDVINASMYVGVLYRSWSDAFYETVRLLYMACT